MAEPVIVPVQLEITDIDMSALNLYDAEKQISKSLSGIRKSIQDTFSGIDPSIINKPIEKAMTGVEKSLQGYEDSVLRYRESLVAAGKTSKEYQSKVSEIDSQIASTKEIIQDLSAMNVSPKVIEPYRKQLNDLINARNKINPIQFIDGAEPMKLEKAANALKKVLIAYNDLTTSTGKFNQTTQDNRATNEYNELLKQAEAYKKKLEDLNKKSKEMQFKGATDTQWENLRKDTEWTKLQMDEVIKKMQTAVKTGKAFRFGEGSAGEFTRGINRFKMSSQNNARYAIERAQKNQSPYTKEYQDALDELDKLEQKMNSIREKSEKMIALGASKNQLQSLVYDAERLNGKVDEVKNNLTNMVQSDKAFKFDGGNADAEIDNIRNKSNNLQSSLTNVANNAKRAQGGLTRLGTTHPKLAAILKTVGNIAKGFGKVMAVTGKVASVIGKGFAGTVKVLNSVAKAAGRVVSEVTKVGKSVVNGIKNFKRFGKSGTGIFKKFNKNFLMFGLGFRTAYYAIRRLRTIFIDSLKVMGDQFDEVGNPMKTLIESFNRLKGSMATAFQPLVSVVMPILTRFMNNTTKMLESIGKFTATLTGQGRIYKAVAKNINSVTDAAGNANDKLGAYDKLEVIQDDKNKTGVDYEMQEVGVEDAASNFAQMVKDAWENADFTSVGAFVSTKLVEILDGVETTLVPKFTGLVNKVLSSATTFLEGFDVAAVGEKAGSIVNALIEQVQVSDIGNLLGMLFREVFDFVGFFTNTIDWAAAGKSLANGLNALITTVDIGKLGTDIYTLFSNAMLLASTLFATVDWTKAATDVATGINNIFGGNFSNFESAITNLNKAITTIVSTSIANIDFEKIFDTLTGFLEHLFRSAGDALAKTDNPLLQALGMVFTVTADAFTLLGPLVKSVLGMIMPLITVLLGEVSKLVPIVTEFTSEFTAVILPTLIEFIKQMAPTLTDIVMRLLPLLMSIVTALKPMADVFINSLLPMLVELSYMVTDFLFDYIGMVVDILVPILPIVAKIIGTICEVLRVLISILSPILDVIGFIYGAFGQIIGTIIDVFLPIMDLVCSVVLAFANLIGILAPILELIASVIVFVANIILTVFIVALKAVIAVIEVILNAITSVVDAIAIAFGAIRHFMEVGINYLKKWGNQATAWVEKIVNIVINAINWVIKAINKLSVKVPEWVPGYGGKNFGFNIREIQEVRIPRLAQGAVIPPNQEFLAMLGDQKHGTNIEAPLDTIKQALAEVLAEVGGGNREPIILQVDGRQLAKVVWNEQEKHYKQTGKYAMV